MLYRLFTIVALNTAPLCSVKTRYEGVVPEFVVLASPETVTDAYSVGFFEVIPVIVVKKYAIPRTASIATAATSTARTFRREDFGFFCVTCKPSELELRFSIAGGAVRRLTKIAVDFLSVLERRAVLLPTGVSDC
jgi:hypothetical protein